MTDNPYDTIVIGAGQAGLASAYYLQRAGSRLLVLDGGGQIGESWLRRWDSLRLFTPVRYNSLPGLPFPGEPYALPVKDDVTRYLQSYVAHFALPVKPHDAFFDRLSTARLNRVAIVGAGVAGAEIAMALRHRGAAVTLYSAQAVLWPPRLEALARRMGVDVRPGTPEALRELLVSEIAKWKVVIERAKIPKQ